MGAPDSFEREVAATAVRDLADEITEAIDASILYSQRRGIPACDAAATATTGLSMAATHLIFCTAAALHISPAKVFDIFSEQMKDAMRETSAKRDAIR